MTPKQIVQKMYDHDAFSQWLGIEIMAIAEGIAELRLTVRPDMTNGFGIAHGGITYSLADSAFAFASNSHGRMAVSIETSISHTVALHSGDTLIARASLESLSNKIGLYRVVVSRSHDRAVVAVFKGTAYRKDSTWV